MKLRLLVGALVLVVALVAADLLLTFVVLPGHWRPAPPFGATTNDAQRAWLVRQVRELDAGEEDLDSIGRFDARLGWSWRANSASPDGRYHFNSRGWRGEREYAPNVPDDTLRIVACGDSFTFGQEVRDEEAWPAILDAGWPEAEVINLGVGGYGTDQALLRFRDEDLGERIDVVLIGILLENIGRNVNRYRPLWYPLADSAAAKPRFVVDGDGLRLVEQPFATRRELVDAIASGAVLDRLREHEYWSERHVPSVLAWSGLARLAGMRSAYAAREVPRLWTRPDDEPFRTTVAILSTFRAEALGRGARVAPILLFPSEQDMKSLLAGTPPYWTLFTETLDAKGIEYLDLSVVLLELAGDEQEAHEGHDHESSLYVGTHLGPEGNEAVARAVRHRLAPYFPD